VLREPGRKLFSANFPPPRGVLRACREWNHVDYIRLGVEGGVQEPEPQVVGAARIGDLDAFESLVRSYQADVWRLSYQLVRDRSLADDVTQEAFLRAFRFLPRYRGEAKFSTWLFTIARNCALDELRRAGRRRTLEHALERTDQPRTSEPSAWIEIREAVAGLSLDLREPLVLIDMFGLSYSEVGTILGLPLGTVKSRVHRARHVLAEHLSGDVERAQGEI
jgi:RNA polymerase sigma-70 factor, ECF subfamily